MHKDNQRFLARMNMLADAGIAFVSLLVAYWIRFTFLPDALVSYATSLIVYTALFSAVVHVIVYGIMGMYASTRLLRMRTLVMRIGICELISMLITISALFVVGLVETSRLVLFISFVLGLFLSSAKYILMRRLLSARRKRGLNQRTCLIIGDGDVARNYGNLLLTHSEFGYRIIGYQAQASDWPGQTWLGSFDALEETLRRHSPDEAVIALRPEDYVYIKDIIKACDKAGVYIRIIPCYDEYTSSKMDVQTVEGINIVDIRVIPLTWLSNRIIKRTMDIVFSAFILLVTSPILLIAAIGVKLTSPGPVLFRQARVGKDKRVFQMLKFRSMRLNDQSDKAWSGKEDDRKTFFGALLRKFSIDELPQFLNILKGDMSIVGPRPEIPHYVEQFRDEIPLYMIKHYVKPGITGWAQVNGYRGDTSIKARIEHDIYYIENWTPLFDLKIMCMTVFKMVNDEKLPPPGGNKKRTDA